MCAGTVAEVIQSVVNGADGCVFCFGHSKLGKILTHAHTHTQKLQNQSSARESSLVSVTIGVSALHLAVAPLALIYQREKEED